jgi:type II secretory pathway predicted ATPase ExeA
MRDGFVIDVRRPLLERASQLEDLERLLARAKGGEGRLVLVEGEAGAGKSALVRLFCAGTARRALTGFCDPLNTPRPLGPFLDVAEQAGGELAARLGRGTSPADVVTALVAELRRVPGAVLVIEDLHWADEATLDALLLLGRRLAQLSALVVLTAREEELQPGHPVRRVLGELATAPGVHRLRLAPLSPAAVRALAGPQRTDAERLHHTTGGNPFFVIEALAAPEGELPATVMDAVLARVHRLRPAARSLLEATAVVAVRAELWLLERIGKDGSGALDECVTAGLLERRGGEVGFRHELARLAVEESIPPDRVAALHRRMLRALRGSDVAVDPARLAHHANGAGEADLVLRFAPAAAEHAASLGAHREAATRHRPPAPRPPPTRSGRGARRGRTTRRSRLASVHRASAATRSRIAHDAGPGGSRGARTRGRVPDGQPRARGARGTRRPAGRTSA